MNVSISSLNQNEDLPFRWRCGWSWRAPPCRWRGNQSSRWNTTSARRLRPSEFPDTVPKKSTEKNNVTIVLLLKSNVFSFGNLLIRSAEIAPTKVAFVVQNFRKKWQFYPNLELCMSWNQTLANDTRWQKIYQAIGLSTFYWFNSTRLS